MPTTRNNRRAIVSAVASLVLLGAALITASPATAHHVAPPPDDATTCFLSVEDYQALEPPVSGVQWFLWVFHQPQAQPETWSPSAPTFAGSTNNWSIVEGHVYWAVDCERLGDEGGNDEGGNDEGGNDEGGNDEGGNDEGGNDEGGNDEGGNDEGGNAQPQGGSTVVTTQQPTSTTTTTEPSEPVIDEQPVVPVPEEAAAPGSAVANAGATLPRTGASILPMLLMALGMMSGGFSLMQVARRES
jgi:hypothetical protein